MAREALPPLVEDRSVYARQTDAVLTLHLTGDPAAIAAVNADAPDASAAVTVRPGDDAAAAEARGRLAVRGGSSRLALQKSFSLELVEGRLPWCDQRVLVLNKHPYDLTRVRNLLSFECFRSIPHMTSLRTQLAHLEVNGGDMGLYTLIETADAAFLAAHGLDPAGALYDVLGQAFELSQLVAARANPDPARIQRMLEAVNDPNRDIDDVVARFFQRDNYLTWLAMNALMGDYDSDAQNFMLYGPSGYDGWYLLPWDYDGAWGWYEQPGQPPRPRWRTGLANWWAVPLHRRFLEQPGNVRDLTALVEGLLATSLSDEKTAAVMARWHDVVKAYISVSPDLDNLPCDTAGTADAVSRWETEYTRIQSTVSQMRGEYETSLRRPTPVFLYEPVVGEPTVLSWQPSRVLAGGAVTYDLLVSRTAGFEPENVVHAQAGLRQALASIDRLAPGEYSWRVVVRAEADPQNAWQQCFADARLNVVA